MLSERFCSNLKQVLAERDFFHKLEAEDFKLKSVGFEWMIRAADPNSRDFLQMPEELLQTLFANAEILQLKNSSKRLTVHKNLLLWFNADIGTDQDNIDSLRLLQGYAELGGAHVESSDAEDAGLAARRMNHGPTKKQRSSHYFKVTLPENASGDSETLYFESQLQKEKWRRMLSDAPVIFTDFESRYQITQQLAKEGRNQIMQVEHKHNKEVLIARAITASHSEDRQELMRLRQKFLEESRMLVQLRSTNITASFREFCFTGKSFLILEEPLEAVRFAEWFTGTWCYEVGAITDQRPVLNLFRDLAMMVLTLNSQSIFHGLISKDTIVVKATCITATPNWVTPKTKRKGVKTFLQTVAPVRFGQLERADLLNDPTTSTSDKPSAVQRGPIRLDDRSGAKLSSVQSGSVEKVENTLYHDPSRKFYLVQFSQAARQTTLTTETTSNPKQVKSNTGRDSSSTFESTIAKSSPEADVFALGALFFEILFGINLARGIAQEHGIETDFVSALLKKPRVVIEYREPLYDIDEKIIDLIGSMLDPDKLKRPTIRHCYNVIQNTTKERGKLRKATKHFTKLRTALYSQFSMDDSIYQGQQPQGNADDPYLNPLSVSEVKSPLYSQSKENRDTSSQEIGFSGQQQFVPTEIVMETALANQEQEKAGQDDQQVFYFSSRERSQVAVPTMEQTQMRRQSNSPPKFQNTPNLPQKLPKKKPLCIGNGLALKPAMPAADKLHPELKTFLGREGRDPLLLSTQAALPNGNFNRIVSLVPQVCVIAREAFKIENKPRKVLLPKGGSSVCSSIFELPSNSNQQKLYETPMKTLPSDTPLSQVSKTNLSLRLRVRGLSASKPSQGLQVSSPALSARPRLAHS